jgi:hypothetical protein
MSMQALRQARKPRQIKQERRRVAQQRQQETPETLVFPQPEPPRLKPLG